MLKYNKKRMNNNAGSSRPKTAQGATGLRSPGNETNFLLRPGPLKASKASPPPPVSSLSLRMRSRSQPIRRR